MGWAAVHLPQNETAVKSQYLHKIDSRLLRVIPVHRNWRLAALDRRESSIGSGRSCSSDEQTLVSALSAPSKSQKHDKQTGCLCGRRPPASASANFVPGRTSAEAYSCLRSFQRLHASVPTSMHLPKNSLGNNWHSIVLTTSLCRARIIVQLFSKIRALRNTNTSSIIDPNVSPDRTVRFAEAFKDEHILIPRRDGTI